MLELVNRNKGIKWDGSSNIYMYKNKEEAKKVLEQIEAVSKHHEVNIYQVLFDTCKEITDIQYC